MPHPEFLQGLDQNSIDAILSEIRKVWVGGYASGHKSALADNGGMFGLPFSAINPEDTATLIKLADRCRYLSNEALRDLAFNCALIVKHRAG